MAVKTFDYDGIKYTASECDTLLTRLNTEFEKIKKQIEQEDIEIFKYFYSLAKSKGVADTYVQKYELMLDCDKSYDSYFDVYVKMIEVTRFMQTNTPYDVIEGYVKEVNNYEKTFKESIVKLKSDKLFSKLITPEIEKQFELYISNTKPYFTYPQYNDETLDLLFNAIQNYLSTIHETYFQMKRGLLDYQLEELISQ